jgi:hypothetical protein
MKEIKVRKEIIQLNCINQVFYIDITCVDCNQKGYFSKRFVKCPYHQEPSADDSKSLLYIISIWLNIYYIYSWDFTEAKTERNYQSPDGSSNEAETYIFHNL